MRAPLVALVVLAVGASPAPAASLHVGIPGRAFTPPRLEAVAGDTVTWHNASSEAHDVGGERMNPGEEVSRAYAEPGYVPYVCVLHPSMAGAIDVVPVALSGPPQAPAAGEPVVLTGRAPEGTPSVALTRDGLPFATVPAAADGTFRVEAPSASATFRAEAGRGASREVRVDVVERVTVGLTARLGRRLTTLAAATAPARPGATAILQLWSRERFAWLRTGTARLDGGGRTTFTLRPRVRRRARVVLLGPGGAPVATSPQAFTWRLSRAPKPVAPHGGHH